MSQTKSHERSASHAALQSRPRKARTRQAAVPKTATASSSRRVIRVLGGPTSRQQERGDRSEEQAEEGADCDGVPNPALRRPRGARPTRVLLTAIVLRLD